MNIQTIDLLIRYHIWATQGLATALEPLSDEDFCKDCGLFFQSISGTFNHLLLADHLWFSRFYHGFSPILPLNHILEPDRTALLKRLNQSCLQWQSLGTALNQDLLNSLISYRSSRGQALQLPYAATLIHVFNHATHHRGQITAALIMLDYASPELDMIYMLLDKQNSSTH